MALGIDNLSYRNIVEGILGLDKSITSVAIARLGSGKILVTQYEKEEKDVSLPPFLTRQESELLTIQSLIRMNSRIVLEHKLGKVLYSSTVYEKVTTASMFLFNHGRRTEEDGYEKENDDDDRILMLSFDNNKNADHELIINSKILPFLKNLSETMIIPPQVDEHQRNKKLE